jgi:signal transduction histidine kinase/CheY-like chemotaxis protein
MHVPAERQETARRIAGRVAGAKARAAMGAELTAILTGELRADAAIVWLPSVQRVEARDVYVSGRAFGRDAWRDAAAALHAGRLADYVATLTAGPLHTVAHPPFVGLLAAAWPPGSELPADLRATMEFVAALAAAALELGETESQTKAIGQALAEAESQVVRMRRGRAVGELASGLVHDFNNCLTTILGCTELALGPLDEDDPTFIDLTTIRTAAMDAAALIKRLQAIGRRTYDEQREVVDLADIARAMPDLVRPRWMRRAQIDGVSFEVIVDVHAVPPVHVIVGELRELLMNLLFNAIDAMPAGGRIVLSTRTTNEMAEIAVRDEGTGMSEEQVAGLFQPFITTKGTGGTGLGLSVCRSIAQRHGGRLTVSSVLGRGSTFTLRLPPAPAAALASWAGRPSADPSLRPATLPIGRRVLLVDDQDEVRDSVGDMLRALGHSVTTASDGSSALDLVRQRPPDVVFTDFGMPGMNGVELGSHLLRVAPQVPVVLISGWGLEHDVHRPKNVVEVLQKPLTMKALEQALIRGSALAPRAALDQRPA